METRGWHVYFQTTLDGFDHGPLKLIIERYERAAELCGLELIVNEVFGNNVIFGFGEKKKRALPARTS